MLYCTACGTVAKPAKKTPGSFLVELVLWLFFLLPGLVYSLWRLSNKKKVCPACGSEVLVPTTSPVAQRAMHPALPPIPR